MVAFANKPPSSAAPPEPPHGFPVPGPEFSPEQVVQFQVYALQHNEDPQHDAGIAAAFEFASPANREATGPLTRFISLVHNGQYAALLNAISAEYGPTCIDGESAIQPVLITTRTGDRVGYVFVLSRQADGPFEGCWMTDAVIPQ